jgi:DNA-binding beta-propeller fold protein YncE
LLGACAVALALPSSASAARTVYFTDPVAGEIAQFAVAADGSLSPLDPAALPAHKPRRLAMTPSGEDLYATADDGVLQFDVAADGELSPKQPPAVYAGDEPHTIAVHPDGTSVYVTDEDRGKVRQFDVGPGGALVAKDPSYVRAGPCARGVAVSQSGDVVYVLVAGGIAVFDVGAGGTLTRRADLVGVPSWQLEDVALTPDGRHMYATSGDGRVFQFAVGADGTPVPESPAALVTGGAPVGIAVAPDGLSVHVTAARSWWHGPARLLSFAVRADGTLAPAAEAEVPVLPWKRLGYLGVSPDGQSLFVAGGDGHLFGIGAGAALAPKTPPAVDLHAAYGVVVSPNQAPVASFEAAPGSAGSETQFDASGAADPDGRIVRYDWDFGDGTVVPDGGPSPRHVYTQPGTYTVTLVVTDNEGASTTTIFTGGTVLGHGRPVAQATLQIQVAAAAAAPPPPPPPGVVAPTQALQPDLGETLLADPISGSIRVRLPGAESFQPLADIEELPMGSTIDARRGRVELTTVRDRSNRLQEGRFYGGVFRVRQRARDRFITELVLSERLARCPRRGSASAARAARRRLWGDGDGRFRSRGRYSSAAVRGTRWLVEDSCEGTLTRVRRGVVRVRDFVRDRTVVLRRGERYLAAPR